MLCLAYLGGILLAVALACHPADAQEQFRLVVPGTNVTSTAELTPSSLTVRDSHGRTTRYERQQAHDAAGYLGYYSAAARQIIRWPTTGQGKMLVGSLGRGRVIDYQRSKMEIQRVRKTVGGGFPGDQIERSFLYRLTSQECKAAGLSLDVGRNGLPTMEATAEVTSQNWTLVPVGNGYFRLECERGGKLWSLASNDRSEFPQLAVTDSDVHQFWRLTPSRNRPGYYQVTNASRASAGKLLQGRRNGTVVFAPPGAGAGQFWSLAKTGRVPPVFAGRKFLSRELQANPPLPPAIVEMANTHDKELWVLVADRRDPAASIRLKIPPHESTTVQFDRDPGATLTEIYELIRPNGLVRREEMVTELPPEPYYDVSVYELFLQSIAIDRTAKGGGRIEDTNYSPKSVGWFVPPAGPMLKSGRMDIYQSAKRHENPGQVRRINPKQWKAKPNVKDPLERLLDELGQNGVP